MCNGLITCKVLLNPHEDSIIIFIEFLQMNKLRLKDFNDNFKQRSLMRGWAELIMLC